MPINEKLKNNYYKITFREITEKNKPEFDVFLYLTTAHLSTQTTKKVIFFQLYRNTCLAPVAIFQCTIEDNNICYSAVSAPFGSIQCQNDCSKEEINYFIKAIAMELYSIGMKEIHINHYAYCYSQSHAKVVADLYLANGFQCTSEKINHHIHVSEQPFHRSIVPAERRRLQKCDRFGLVAQMDMEPNPEIIYQFLSYCRRIKGYQLSLGQSELATLMIHFPTQVLTFSVKLEEKIIAAVVTIRVNTKILYSFLIDSLPEYKAHSPTVMLINCVYEYCQKEKIDTLDLGTSPDQSGMQKASLIRFKENIGGVRSIKKSFCIQLNQIPRQFPSR